MSLRADVPQRAAIDYTLRLEIVHRALARVFPGCGRELDVTTDVVLLRHRDDYQAIAPEGTGGFFSEGRAALVASPARMVVRVAGAEQPRLTEVLVHELTHRFVSACYPDAPTWLHEGLAEYFETMRLRDDEIVLGTAAHQFTAERDIDAFVDRNGRVILRIPRDRVPRPSAILAMTPERFYHGGGASYASDEATLAYAGAWALVHSLMLGPSAELRTQFRDYLGLISLGREDGRGALVQSIDLDSLDGRLEPYFAGAQLLVRRVPYDWPPIDEPVARPMATGEAHSLWAELHANVRSQASLELAARHLELALESPEHAARALLLTAAFGREDRVRRAILRARRIAPHEPDVIRAWAILALKHGNERTRQRAVAMMLERAERRAVDAIVLADLALSLGDPTAAIAHARDAVAADPVLLETRFALGRALAQAGQFQEARRELEVVTNVAFGRPALAAEARRIMRSLDGR